MKDQDAWGIKSWAEDDRPREKLQNKGKSALSDAELIAILLGSGSRRETAVDLAKRLLASTDHNLNALGRYTIGDLSSFKGIGEAKAINIISALELGKRRRHAEALKSTAITNSEQSYELLQPKLGDLGHEEFWVLFLSRANKVLAQRCISQGGITGTVADQRLIFREALNLQATSLVLAHNHPSGQCKPSRQDSVLTKKIVDASRIMDIQVLDHLIVTEKDYFSFADEGLI